MTPSRFFDDPRVVDAAGIPAVGPGGRLGPIRLLRVSEAGSRRIIRHGGYQKDGSWWMARSTSFAFEQLEKYLPRMARRVLVPDVVDLIPSSSWFASLANMLTRESWSLLRDPLVSYQGGCQDCGYGVRLEAHEAWSYDAVEGVQSLDGILVLCRWCHETRHLGRANATGRFDSAIERLSAVNRIRADERRPYVDEVFRRWEERSVRSWQLRLPLPVDMMLRLRPSIRHEGDGWLVDEGSSSRPACATRVVDIGVGEDDRGVVLVGLSQASLADAYASSQSSCNSSDAALARG